MRLVVKFDLDKENRCIAFYLHRWLTSQHSCTSHLGLTFGAGLSVHLRARFRPFKASRRIGPRATVLDTSAGRLVTAVSFRK